MQHLNHPRLQLAVTLSALLIGFGGIGVALAEPGDGPPPPRQGERNERGDRDRGDRPPPPPRDERDRGERREARDGDGERGEPGERRERRLRQMMFKDIELTDDQKQSLKQLREDRKDEMQEIRGEMRDAHEAKDREAMRAAGDKMRAFLEETHTLIAAELNDEQREQFEANVEELKERMDERRERRAERDDRPRRGGGERERPATQPAE